MRTSHTLSLLTLLALAGGCSSSDPEAAPAAKAPESPVPVTETVEPYTCGAIPNLHIQGGVMLAGQPTADDLRAAAELGVRTVLDVRTPGELKDFDEPALVGELGMVYRNFGFRSPDQLTDEVFDGVRALLADPAAAPILFHCGSANRVGAVWLAHRVLDEGVELEAAVEQAHAVGLRSAELEARALAYIASKR